MQTFPLETTKAFLERRAADVSSVAVFKVPERRKMKNDTVGKRNDLLTRQTLLVIEEIFLSSGSSSLSFLFKIFQTHRDILAPIRKALFNWHNF